MPIINVDIHLQQPAIISLHPATAGTHQGLDFIPGATLLGHAASRLYAQLDEASAWLLFHSGKVRFGDALPLGGNGQTSLPMPLSWHVDKGKPATKEGRLIPDHVYDPSMAAPAPAAQPAALRSGHVTVCGQRISVQRLQTLKTAIDARRGMAADGQLFGYEAMAADQHFRATVQADADVPESLWQQLLQALSGNARLGRSRSAQFGLARLQTGPASASATPPCTGQQLTLLLLSDLALEYLGQPCLEPLPQLLGLPEGSHWLPTASFLRQRRYSPFNGWRRHYDPERQVISRGSVLRFELPRCLDQAERLRLADGLGLYQESGLGQILVNPALLANASPSFEATATTAAIKEAPVAVQPDSTLARVLAARAKARDPDRIRQIASQLMAAYDQRLQDAKAFNPLAMPPGRSQWGRLKQLASDHRHDARKLSHALFDPENGVLRDRSGWNLRFGTGPDDTLHNWLAQELQKAGNDLPELVGHLAVQGLAHSTKQHASGEASLA